MRTGLNQWRNWRRSETEVFWGEIAPCEHLVQIYSEDAVFLDCLHGFVDGGLKRGEAVIVIATQEHLRSLEARLEAQRVNVAAARAEDQFIPLDAEETLSQFMVSGWPDEERFQTLVNDLLARAGKNERRVRAFGEMVAILWAKGHNGATVRLEHLWNRLCESHRFSLFCAYPRTGFTQATDVSMHEICAAHTRIVAG